MKINEYLLALLLSCCLVGCDDNSVQLKFADASSPEPIPLTQEQDDALVEAGILPPEGFEESTQSDAMISPSKFTDDAVAEILSLYDKQMDLFDDYKRKEISLWETIDNDIAKHEEASYENDQFLSKLNRDLLHYRLTHPPVNVYGEKQYGGLLGWLDLDGPEAIMKPAITDKEDTTINYKERKKKYSDTYKSLKQPHEAVKSMLLLRKKHAAEFQKLDVIWEEMMPNLDQQITDSILKNAQQLRDS